MDYSPLLIKPLLQGVQTWRGLHNALHMVEWASPSGQQALRGEIGEERGI